MVKDHEVIIRLLGHGERHEVIIRLLGHGERHEVVTGMLWSLLKT